MLVRRARTAPIAPPACVYLCALLTRFVTTWTTRSRSPSAAVDRACDLDRQRLVLASTSGRMRLPDRLDHLAARRSAPD